MSKRKCGACGKDPAEGLASVTQHGVETFYCHGDDDAVSCYESRDWQRVAPVSPLDPEHKSGHFGDDAPCWCGDVHYYRVAVPEHEHVTVDARFHWALIDLHVQMFQMLRDGAVDLDILRHYSAEAEAQREQSVAWNAADPDHHAPAVRRT